MQAKGPAEAGVERSEAGRGAANHARAASAPPETDARPGRSLVWHLALFASALVVPAFLFIAILMAQVASGERARYERTATTRAVETAAAIDAELAGLAAAARAFATDPALAGGELDAFAARARAVLRQDEADVVVTDADGRRLVDTRAAAQADGATPDPAFAWERLSPGGSPVSDLIEPQAGEPLVAVSARASIGEGVPLLVSIAIPARRVLPPIGDTDFTHLVYDRRGLAVSSSRDHERVVGARAEPGLVALTAAGAGHFTKTDARGDPMLAGHARTVLSDWTVLATIPQASARAQGTRMLLALSALGLGLFAIASGMAIVFGRRAADAIGRLETMARAVGSGRRPEPLVSRVREANAVGDTLVAAADALALRAAELGASERRLREVLDNLFAVVAVMEVDGTLVEVNRTPLRAMGLARGALIGCRAWEVPPFSEAPASAALVMQAVERAREGVSSRFDLDIARPDGRRMVLDVQVAGLRDERGAVHRIVASGVDVTARERATGDLRESEERLRLAVAAGRLGSWEVDLASGRCIVSPRTAEIFGVAPETLGLHADWLQFVLPEDRDEIASAFEAAIVGAAPYRVVYRLVRPSGEIRFVASRALVQRDERGRARRFIGVHLDVTDERRAEEELRRAVDLLRIIGETTPDPIWVRDGQGRFVFANPALGRLVGADAEALVGDIGRGPAAAEAGLAAFGADMAVIGEGVPRVVEEDVVPPGDHRRTFLVSKTPMRDARGRVTGLVCVASDITDRKRAEERQALMVRELHHRVKNSLATVQAIANATARTATDVAAFREAFNARIISLARTHTLLTENAWGVIRLRDLLETELSPYAHDVEGAPRVRIDGPDLALPSDVALSLGMAIHELTTNAAKYGALSTPTGSLTVAWAIDSRAGRRLLRFDWTERGGPPVGGPPTRQGFGTRLLRHMLGGQLEGEIDMRFEREGVSFALAIPLVEPAPPSERAA